MAKYRLTEEGVLDTETGGHIPNDSGNRHWQEYQEWLVEGNTPDPKAVPPAPSTENLLSRSDDKMIRTIDWILETLVAKGVITLAEIPQALKDLYVARKALRNA